MVAPENVHEEQARKKFAGCGRTHVLMITNHGVHEWKVVPGMPDTGGQNVYVNQFTEALVAQGYRVTIANRGGYPHPKTGEMQCGVVYHPSGYARIIYLEDGRGEFVRKEDMDEQIPALVEDLARKIEQDNDRYDLIVSHYWDAGKIGVLFNKRCEAKGQRIPHVFVPHSLGALKKRNMDPSTWANLRIEERIANEKELMKDIDGGVATSTTIRDTFKNDYGYDAKYFLPPCIDEERNRVREPSEYEPIWGWLAEQCGLSDGELKGRKLVTEISRTDKTKRKDVVIKAFAQARRREPEAFLLVSIDPQAKGLYDDLLKLIAEEGVRDHVLVLGSVWDQLPLIYNATSVYITPSVMEGFGMSAQEAAASGKPVIASDLVPFVCEYLLGGSPQKVALDGKDLLFGEGGVVVPADFVAGFAEALARLLEDDARREHMGRRAREITIPYFTWRHMTESLLSDLGVSPAERMENAS
ncbi:MAG: glycosyltransferase [Phycisphaerales bacterium]|nr:MAG: glycosyltransferase [Phycisphaerales bacterium]